MPRARGEPGAEGGLSQAAQARASLFGGAGGATPPFEHGAVELKAVQHLTSVQLKRVLLSHGVEVPTGLNGHDGLVVLCTANGITNVSTSELQRLSGGSAGQTTTAQPLAMAPTAPEEAVAPLEPVQPPTAPPQPLVPEAPWDKLQPLMKRSAKRLGKDFQTWVALNFECCRSR